MDGRKRIEQANRIALDSLVGCRKKKRIFPIWLYNETYTLHSVPKYNIYFFNAVKFCLFYNWMLRDRLELTASWMLVLHRYAIWFIITQSIFMPALYFFMFFFSALICFSILYARLSEFLFSASDNSRHSYTRKYTAVKHVALSVGLPVSVQVIAVLCFVLFVSFLLLFTFFLLDYGRGGM